MERFIKTGVLIFGLLWSVILVAAEPFEQLQMPHCLAEKLGSYEVIAENAQYKILNIPVQDMDKVSHLAEKGQCGRFVNVSESVHHVSAKQLKQNARNLLFKSLRPKRTLRVRTYPITHQELVKKTLAAVDSDGIWDTLAHMTSFTNRSAILENGVLTAEWLKSSFERMATEYGCKDCDAFFVKSGRFYKQPSVVTVLGKDINAPALVIGAHMDTLGGFHNERMPGAGDDGSGSASVMEIARVLMASDIKLKRPIYFIWYAAEERGLIGSQQVVRHFKTQGIPVEAAIQFDMTGFRNNQTDQTMWVFRDYTDKALSDFTADLIKTYIKVPVAYSKCGYGCSDHASWMAEGIPAAFPCETSFEDHNPYIHSASDTMDLLNLEHMTHFTKLGVAFAIELAAA